MNPLTLLLAWRYALGSQHEKNIASMVKVCFLGILIGSFSLALVIAVMNGFEKVTHEKMQSIHAQIIMRSHGHNLDYEKVSHVLRNEFPEVAFFSPTSYQQVIIQPTDSDDITNLIALKSIDPAQESLVTTFDKKIIASASKDLSLKGTITDDTILIGQTLAKNLNLSSGDTINILFPDNEKTKSRKITLAISQATVGGIFTTGIDEFDAGLALCNHDFFNTLFPNDGVTQINIKLKPDAHEQVVITRLKERFQLEVYSWQCLYPALVAALKLEKYAMFLILALITLVASMNIISLLFMQITQKRGDIAILKAMGLSDGTISRIFLLMGMGITCCATLLGLALATLASWVLETYPFITLPDAYYVTHLPSKMEWHLLLIVFIVIMCLSFIATLFPAYRTRSINIAQILRFEA
ncbi:MAG: FtsX-like permease family protein [Candidatus Dependentiae bacterium]|nr:FtsX-like permease family protein [Candidatus Dependentiae bacterium]